MQTVPAAFALHAQSKPAAPAVRGTEYSITYAALEKQADSVAIALAELGVVAGDFVGLAVRGSAELVAGMLGVLKTGAAYVPLDPGYPADRIQAMCQDTHVSLIIAEPATAAPFRSDGRRTVMIHDLVAAGDGGLPWTRDQATSDSLAYVMFTSGTSGRPKGVAVSHRNILRLAHGLPFLDLGPGSVVLQFAALGFDAATFEIWAPLLNGGCVAFPESGTTALDLTEQIPLLGADTMFLTTALFNELVDVDPGAVAGLKQLLFGGEAASAERVERLLNIRQRDSRLVHCYGPTETTTFATCAVLPAGAVRNGAAVPIGREIGGTSLRLYDDGLEPSSPGETAQLYIGGSGVAHGYLGRPGLTAERFVPDPSAEAYGARLYRTGDSVRRGPGGALEFVGRLDRQIKVRGFRVEPGEVEYALRTDPGIRDAVVTGRVDASGFTQLVAFFIAAGDEPTAPEEIKKRLERRLPSYMIPTRLFAVDRFPLTATGKTDMDRLLGQASGRGAVFEALRPPSTNTEKVLADIWCDVLGLSEVGVDDNFFSLGGDSILCIGVVTQAEERGLVFSLVDLFRNQTIGELAEVADAAAG
ncbi:amino acid adenylation domain-containing protein [Catenulispora sp. EB89]|uniref:amino acid adenylation domain-containing protein n=1 Tax=Catenulispora sp. EB89 TaxID=3156257 RepID=UPI003517AAA6